LSYTKAIYTTRSMRRLRPDLVPDDLLLKVIEAATMGPSGSNRQPWRFIVVKDQATKEFVGVRYRKAWDRYLTPKARAVLANPPDSPQGKILRSARYLANHLEESPALIFACVKVSTDRKRAGDSMYNAIFPALQNLCLAARGSGLGTSTTGLHRMFGEEIDRLLGVPREYANAALIPIGYPKGRAGRPARKPAAEVAYWENWGAPRGVGGSTS